MFVFALELVAAQRWDDHIQCIFTKTH